jgi:hypothetical protein
MYRAKAYIVVYIVLIAGLAVFSAVLYENVSYLNSYYSVHNANINTSSLCGLGKPSMLMYYDNTCEDCFGEYAAFRNDTSLFGIWTGQDFYSGYFCAYAFNMSGYSTNGSVSIPPEALSILRNTSGGSVPLFIFGGAYSKIGSYPSLSAADSGILEYICKSINNSAPQCG